MLMWAAFFLGLILFTWADYYIEKRHAITTRLIVARVIFWIFLAVAFNVFVYFKYGHVKALNFLTGYIVEYTLSIDNLFVFIMLFEYFKVNTRQEMKALQWGIYGAIVFRLIFIVFGVTLINLFHPVIYVFGAILLFTAYKMQFSKRTHKDPNNLPLVKLIQKIIPVSGEYHEDHFFIKRSGKIVATPLLILVIAVESTDIMFAVDSIPAILAITRDPFIVFTSNIFAILGLRSLFFLLDKIIGLFRYLKTGVAVILAFVGLKMLFSDLIHIPSWISLSIIVLTLAGSIMASLRKQP